METRAHSGVRDQVVVTDPDSVGTNGGVHGVSLTYLRKPILFAISRAFLYSSSVIFLSSAGGLYSTMLPILSILGLVKFTAFSMAGTKIFLTSSGIPDGA